MNLLARNQKKFLPKLGPKSSTRKKQQSELHCLVKEFYVDRMWQVKNES